MSTRYDELIACAQKDGVAQLVVGAFVFNQKNKLLLLQRDKEEFMGGLYELPSGGVEEKESVPDALIREVKEETGIAVQDVQTYVGHFDYQTKKGIARQLNFLVSVTSCSIELSDEHHDYMWVDPDNLPDISEIDKVLRDQISTYLNAELI